MIRVQAFLGVAIWNVIGSKSLSKQVRNNQGYIQTQNGSVQALWSPKKSRREKENCCCLIDFSSKQ